MEGLRGLSTIGAGIVLVPEEDLRTGNGNPFRGNLSMARITPLRGITDTPAPASPSASRPDKRATSARPPVEPILPVLLQPASPRKCYQFSLIRSVAGKT